MIKNDNNIAAPAYEQRALNAHRWLGLLAASFLYLLCFSGVVSMLAQELERWEQPAVDEFSIEHDYRPEFIDQAYRQFLKQQPEESEHIHIVFPRAAIPRIVVENDHKAFFVNHDGSIGAEEHAPWTKMVANLHKHLHMPQPLGTIISGIVAMLLLGLIVSGILSHKTIFKEAFRLRLSQAGLRRNIDWHNRLSVWGLPFHLMISLSSVYFGLVGILLILAASLFYNGDQSKIIEQVFGKEPELHNQAPVVNVKRAIENLREIAPGSKPIFMTIHDAGSDAQFAEFYVLAANRLIYSENYRFDAAGEFIEKVAADQHVIGLQILLSTYRLHFGDYSGRWVKIMYMFLGAALCYICISGVNIWLSKRRYKDKINVIWSSILWGSPLAIAASLVLSLLGANPTQLFWLILLACVLLAMACPLRLSNNLKRILAWACPLCCLLAAVIYAVVHKEAAANTPYLSMLAFLIGSALVAALIAKLDTRSE